jgi:archaellin
MILVKSKNDKYEASEIKFSKKWHQFGVDKKTKDAFYLSNTVGSNGIDVEVSHIITHLYKNIDQMTNATTPEIKFTTQEQNEYNQLLTYRDLKKSLMLINVMNLEK